MKGKIIFCGFTATGFLLHPSVPECKTLPGRNIDLVLFAASPRGRRNHKTFLHTQRIQHDVIVAKQRLLRVEIVLPKVEQQDLFLCTVQRNVGWALRPEKLSMT
jgi:hypothetical protein